MVSICGLCGWLDVDICKMSWFLGVVNRKESINSKVPHVLAAFETLFNIIESKGCVGSCVNVEPALTCVNTLPRFNSANQAGCNLLYISVSPYQFCRTTSMRALSQPLSFPFFNPPRTCLPNSPHNNLLFSSGMNLEADTSLVAGTISLLVSSRPVKSVIPQLH